VLKHPHIVSLHGITAGSVETNLASGKECGFFIVVDRLVETLEARLEGWRTEQEKNGSPRLTWLSSEHKQKKKAELLDRIKIAMQIADAMHYLHSMGIVFRDLKPDNMGFDENGVLKLFDFGLAKELKSNMKHDDGKYDLTGNTGRYALNYRRVLLQISCNHSGS
jgi:serine/threonine protein kinase